MDTSKQEHRYEVSMLYQGSTISFSWFSSPTYTKKILQEQWKTVMIRCTPLNGVSMPSKCTQVQIQSVKGWRRSAPGEQPSKRVKFDIPGKDMRIENFSTEVS